jgi:serine/threonine-protein kinase
MMGPEYGGSPQSEEREGASAGGEHRSRELHRLLAAALEVDAAERPRVLGALTSDPGLVREVLTTLEGEDDLGTFLDRPAIEALGGEPKDGAAASREEGAPLGRWDRYEVRRLLGSGGMGEVYEAFDPRLQRSVALKVLKAGDPSLVERFQREARAQARIDHPHVCPVYEVGEVEGRPYIAMQLVAGKTLAEAAGELDLEQRLRVMVAVCEGLHAAHRTGLIHRDVKPGNVMIGDDGDGGLGVWVMDFGVAWDPGSPALTQTGSMLGTPNYMAPEQVSPSVGPLDRRTDVYGLGVTLYRLLTGRSLFSGQSSIEIMRQVLEREPTPPRKLVPSLPRDLETIVLKCVEKDPARRYPSARALGEDLRRYLDGEPVAARRATWTYKLAKKAGKHRALVGVAAAALILVLAATAAAVQARLQSRAAAATAQRFGRDVESLEWLQLASHQMPLHDVRPERELLRRRMEAIEARMEELGEVARGPGLYALGRGHLALQEYEKAEELLTRAWELGYRAPEVADALGRALGERYGAALAEARRLADPAARDARRRQIETRFREPALHYLRAGQGGAADAPALTAARIAFYEERHEESVAQARAAVAAIPWLYGAFRVEGDAELARAAEAERRGDYDRAAAGYEAAETAYRKAAAIGESDPETHLALCRLGRPRVLLASNRTGGDLEPYVAAAVADCGRALEADPERADAVAEMASLHSYKAEATLRRGEDPGASLVLAEETARRAVALAPGAAASYLALGLALSIKSERQAQLGEDSRPALEDSIASIEHVLELDPEWAHAWHLLGYSLIELARAERRRGGDPRPLLERAIASAERSLAIAPEVANTYLGLSVALYQLARVAERREEDPLPFLDRGADVLRQALERDPNLGFAYLNLAAILHRAAKYRIRGGIDPRPAYSEVEATLETALTHYPDPFAYFNLGHVNVSRARYEAGAGRDPLPWLERAREKLARGIELAPGRSGPPASLGEAWLLEASWIERRGGDPSAALAKAEAGAAASLALSPTEAEGLLLAGRVATAQGRRLALRGESPAEAFARARRSIDAAREQGAEEADARLALAALEIEEGRQEAAREEAGSVLERALALNPGLVLDYGLALRGAP